MRFRKVVEGRIEPQRRQRWAKRKACDREGGEQKKQEEPETTREIDVRKTKRQDSVKCERGAVRLALVALDQRDFEAAEVEEDILIVLDEADEYAAKKGAGQRGQKREEKRKSNSKAGRNTRWSIKELRGLRGFSERSRRTPGESRYPDSNPVVARHPNGPSHRPNGPHKTLYLSPSSGYSNCVNPCLGAVIHSRIPEANALCIK
ncbi:hypothetical protein DFH07DRAFT_771832 [Mycena maculata]|uniref:Uncharacterized protein n=1 Tax=Mycena maculata TaxID=230809 RepID=A0AAD7JB73_9AGAR|nr:hypothetical protein DFH07DRAFT_771832 [Mycena maculata]